MFNILFAMLVYLGLIWKLSENTLEWTPAPTIQKETERKHINYRYIRKEEEEKKP